MTFTRKYLLSVLVPPAIVTAPLAFVFLSQVLQFSGLETWTILFLFVLMYGVSGLLFARGMTPHLQAVEEALKNRSDLSEPMSATLRRTTILSAILWFGAALLFAIAGTLLMLRTLLGFAYFLLAATICAFPSVVWASATGKKLLIDAAEGAPARYVGRQIRLSRKIAITFIGCFVIAALTLIALVSSRVSTTLEGLAIASAADTFDRVVSDANILARVDEVSLRDLQRYVPPGYTIHHIDRKGVVTSANGDALTADEIAFIRRHGRGDSSSFISPHVMRFATLKDRSILVLAVPWAIYRNIPLQMTFYTVVIAFITTIVFVIGTYLLSRDVTTPVSALGSLAREMARGNFDAQPAVFSDDEIGELANDFSETRSNLRRLLGRIGGSGTTITEGVRVITGGTEGLLTRARDQAQLTENSSTSVENVRGGIRSVLTAAETVTELTQDSSTRALELQASAEEVAKNMDSLFQSVEKTSASTTEMNASMAEMSRRVDVLAGIGDEVLSFVAQMDSTVDELRRNSQATADISRQVREDAEGGGEAVQRTVAGINVSREMAESTATALDELHRSVSKINEVLDVIEEITNRTNLLALNAAIIAAQAGEHGLGFSVVADEIRELAERTRGSTKQIGEIIKAVQFGSRQAVSTMHVGLKRSAENVRLADEATQSLSKIVASATQSFEMATKISRSLADQSAASRHLHDVTSRMSDHIAEMNRATREQARGTQLMAEESERVREIALQVKNATAEQSTTGRGITTALERIADDAREMRDLLQRQLHEADQIADASRVMLDIAQENDAIARDFNATVHNLVESGQTFETEVARFRYKGG